MTNHTSIPPYLHTSDARPIGVFDSGVGGLSVLSKLEKLMPNESYIYLADEKNLPYGTKTPEELLKITSSIFKWFESQNVKAVVMACNTTSATVYDDLNTRFNFEIFPIIQGAVNEIELANVKNIGVFATLATVKSKKYTSELQKKYPRLNVFEIACPGWVEIVESASYNDLASKNLIKYNLDKMLGYNVEKIILGCTHYPFLLPALGSFASPELFIDPSVFFVKHIAKSLASGQKGLQKAFYTTGEPANFLKAAQNIYATGNSIPQKVNLTF